MSSEVFSRITAARRLISFRKISRAWMFQCRRARICCFWTAPDSAEEPEERLMRFSERAGMQASAGRRAMHLAVTVIYASIWHCRRQNSWKRLAGCGIMFSPIRIRRLICGSISLIKIRQTLRERVPVTAACRKQINLKSVGIRTD